MVFGARRRLNSLIILGDSMITRLELVGGTSVAPLTPIEPRPISEPPLITIPVREFKQSDWQRALSLVTKHWRASLTFLVAVAVAVTAVTLAIKPTYEPEGRLQIDPPGAQVFSLDPVSGGASDSEYIATETQKLQTDDLAVATIRNLHLDQNPEFVGDAAKEPQTTSSNPEQLTPREDTALRTFSSHLSVRRDPSSRLITISFDSHDPKTAADVVNSLMKLFVQRNFELRHDAISESSVWLARELDDIREKMLSSSTEVEHFQRLNAIPDLDPSSNSYAVEMTDLDRQLAEARSERIQLTAYLKPGSDPQSLPQVRNNPVIQALMQKRAETNANLAQAKVIYGANHPEVRKLQNQSDELGRGIRDQLAGVVAELRTSYRAAQAREQLMANAVKGATQNLSTLSQYNTLKKQAQADRELYDSLYAKAKEAAISAVSKSSNIHIVNQARILEHPTRPHRLLNIAAGLLVGLIGAVVLAFVREGIEDRIHTAEDIRYWTGQSSISVVPAIEPANQQKLLFTPGRKLLPIVAGENAEQHSDLFILARPTAPESEAVHALRTTLLLCHKKCAMKVIVVTSPLPGEGKTTLANNLAIAFSSAGRTCLVDADLRRPSAGSSFRLDPCKGLEHYLRGVATLEEVSVEPDGMNNLVIIPSILPTDIPIQLLNDKTMRDLISRLRGMFDFVVLDTPPILPYADSRALAAIADGVVLVSRAGQTSRGAMKRSMELLYEVQSAPILTTVLNGAQNLSPDYGYYYSRYN
jgi:capsular exopolysaccharide synthesis family protein